MVAIQSPNLPRLAPCEVWHLISEYQKLEEFTNNLLVTNDLAERVGDY